MSAKRLYAPSILINSVEYQCKARSVSLEPGDWINMCEQDWTFSAELEIGYGSGESWTLLEALENTLTTVILKPEADTVTATNPSATFSIRVPAVPFMTSVARGERMIIPLDVLTEAALVFAVT